MNLLTNNQGQNDTLTYSTNPNITPDMDKQAAGRMSWGWVTKTVPWTEEAMTQMVRTESYSASTFSDTHRVKESVMEMHSINLDFDKGNPTLFDYIEKMVKNFQFSAFVYTTVNHQKPQLDKDGYPKEPVDKYRVNIPLKRPLSKEEAQVLEDSDIIERMFELISGSLDSTCKDSNRFFITSPDAKCYFHEYKDEEGNNVFLDPYQLLKEAPSKKSTGINATETFSSDDEVELKNHTKVKFSEIESKTEVICPYCDPNNRQHPDQANAFVDYNDKGNMFLFCSSENKTRWQMKDFSDKALEDKCCNFYSYQTKVNEGAIVGDKFYLEPIGKEKFLIKVGAMDREEERLYYNYLVRNRHIQGLNRIDYVGDMDIIKSEYAADLERGLITVRIRGIADKIADNQFIEEYLEATFGKYKQFIKEWLAVYCYSNYQDLPTLILTGARGTGKNTFAEMVYEIFPTLSSIARDISSSFNPAAESKLLIIDESDSMGKLQYQTLKNLSGSKYIEVNKKYVPQYQVWNNLNVIFLSNEQLPIYVERDEMPTDEANNQFFVYEMKKFATKIDPELDKKLSERMGHYIRTELRRVFESLSFAGLRYSIKVPITDEERKLFENSLKDEDILAEMIIDELLTVSNKPYWVYREFVADGYIPTAYFDEKLERKVSLKPKVIDKLRKMKYLTMDKSDKHQAGGDRQYCYRLGQAWYNEASKKVPVQHSEDRHSDGHTEVQKDNDQMAFSL